MMLKRRIGPPFTFIASRATTPGGPSVVTDGLTHYYPMDNANLVGTPISQINDTIGTLHATKGGSGTLTRAVGPNGQADTAIQFDGSSWGAIGSPVFSSLLNNASVCIWFLIPSISSWRSGGLGSFFCNLSDGTEGVSTTWVETEQSGSGDRYESGPAVGSGNIPYHRSDNSTPSDATWTFISWTHASGGTDCLYYVNNSSIASGPVGASQGANVVDYIGARNNNSRVLPSGCRLAHLMIYENKILSLAEVQQNYNATV